MENEKCQELANIEYQNMLLNGGNNSTNSKTTKEKVGTIDDIELFLEKEKLYESKLPWGKLNKIKKFEKISDYISEFSKQNSVPDKNKHDILGQVKIALNRKKLQRVKDVIYDKENEKIQTIPAIVFDKTQKIFSLKINEKKQSTLKSLAPKKNSSKKTKKPKSQKTQKKASPRHNTSAKIKLSPNSVKNMKINTESVKHNISPKNNK